MGDAESGAVGKRATHGNARRVGLRREVLGVAKVRRIVPAAEHAHDDPRAAGAEGLLSAHRGKDRFARILLGPDRGQASGAEILDVRKALRRWKETIRLSRTAVALEVILGDEARRRDVRVGRGGDPVLKGVGAEIGLELQTFAVGVSGESPSGRVG